jgi:DNA-binding protein YbaB
MSLDGEEHSPDQPEIQPRQLGPYYAEAEIQHGLGRVGVDRNGALVGIELDEVALRRVRPDPLGDYVLAALRTAEEMARQKRTSEHDG